LAPDVIGRGKSDFASDTSLYANDVYAGDILQMLAKLGVKRVIWVGVRQASTKHKTFVFVFDGLLFFVIV
jgi:pimeloyl-ACP methyl ester carboxylesterase